MSKPKRIVVKLGSQALCAPDGALAPDVLQSLADQVAALRNHGWQVLLVSSGAVASGRGLAEQATRCLTNPVTIKQVLAAVGQVHLVAAWQRAFQAHDLITAQVLLSKADFQSREHYLDTRACLGAALAAGFVPIINENDVVAATDFMFSDNDELAGLLAGMMGAEVLALLSSVEGVLNPQSGQLIETWDDKLHTINEVVQSGGSKLGRGGMHSKLAEARKSAALGTRVVIANGRADNVLRHIVSGDRIGTHFPPSPQVAPAKRWLAVMDDHAQGVVTVNDGARDALMDNDHLASLLPVGIERVEGDFERGDVIQVRDLKGKLLGCGRADYDDKRARALLGQRDQKPLIHYDYLYIND
jgi:glutamate 5-kinase